jgi:hypothetical protein
MRGLREGLAFLNGFLAVMPWLAALLMAVYIAIGLR